MTHQDYKEMLALHALAALDPADRRVMQEHLVTCAECPADLAGWQGTAGALACLAEPVEPSPQVRNQILESVRAETSNASVAAKAIQLKPTSPRRLGWFPRFAAVAASLILVALIIGLIILWRQNRTARTELARLSALNEEAQRARDRDQKTLELLSSPGTRIAQLAGTKDAPAAHAALAYDPKSGRAILITHGLPPAPAGKAYQLWFIVGDLPLPGRIFALDASGKAISADQIPAQALQTPVFAVTQETASGAKTPTGPILLRSTL